MIVLSILLVLVAGAVAALAVGRIGAGVSIAMPEPVHTTGHDVLANDTITRADVASVRFDRAARGYRMDQVDAVLDRLADEIARRDDRLALLEPQRSAATAGVPLPVPGHVGTDIPPADTAAPPASVAVPSAETDLPPAAESRGSDS